MSYNKKKSEKKWDIPYISLSTLIFLSKGKYINIYIYIYIFLNINNFLKIYIYNFY